MAITISLRKLNKMRKLLFQKLSRNYHKNKTTQPNSMIMVSFFSEKDVLSDEARTIWNWKVLKICHSTFLGGHQVYRVAQIKRNSRFFRTLLSDQQLSFFTLLDRASFPHYNNTKIIKFGWELFILWVISYGLSFSGFARFPEFRGTINDSFGRP